MGVQSLQTALFTSFDAVVKTPIWLQNTIMLLAVYAIRFHYSCPPSKIFPLHINIAHIYTNIL
jgi:hypothetical protein